MKAIIIGNSGSGKSYLGRAIRDSTAVKLVELDNAFWEPGGYNRKRPKALVHSELNEIAEHDGWIVEGVFGELAEVFLQRADWLLWLDLPWEDCEASLLGRGSESSRQLDSVEAEKKFRELLSWARDYWVREDMRSSVGHRSLYDRFEGKRRRLASRAEVDEFITNQGWSNQSMQLSGESTGR